ncbi:MULTISPECIES: VOC family protein [Rhodococcus]|uniref:Glyoxalase n=1 Tax=Rhodococcus opacus TaxID=37919 RepID=A0A076F5P4_RHOOP|nr:MULTISPECIES: VOC family protein [Rhodococcus]AII11004.1 glyoxalase [Rhodococcus opacus]OUS79713.1 glyoxalase [Rhodococcus sp. NCIMB 12038]
MIELIDIQYVRSGTANAAEAVRFATEIVGMEYRGAENGVHYLRADQRHHCLAFVEGESGVLSSGLSVADSAALIAADEELTAAGIRTRWGTPEECHSRHVREFLEFSDPWGNRFDLVVDPETDVAPINFSRPAGITEFGHLCVDAPDPRKAYEWWSSLFNMKISDWIGNKAALIRFDPVHHKFAIFQGERPGLCHINFQVESIDDVMRSWHVLVNNGVEIEQGPGRHPQSGAIFIYFKGPEGLTYEYSFGVRRIEDDAAWTPRYFDPSLPHSIDMWAGPTQRASTQYQILADSHLQEV